MGRAFYEYLFDGYTLGYDFRPTLGDGKANSIKQIHDTSKDAGGNYIATDHGKLDLHPRFLAHLDGVPVGRVREAIDLLKTAKGFQVEGWMLAGALEYFQFPERYRVMGVTATSLCTAWDVSRSTLYRLRDQAAEIVEALVFKRDGMPITAPESAS